MDKIITLDKFQQKNEEIEKEKENIETQIRAMNRDSSKYFKLGTLVYLVSQHADEIYEILDPTEISSVIKYVFDEITLYNGKMQYKYTQPFEVLRKVVEITNESSKVLQNANIAHNIFEPLKKVEETVQMELVSAFRSEIRRAWNVARTFLLKFPQIKIRTPEVSFEF